PHSGESRAQHPNPPAIGADVHHRMGLEIRGQRRLLQGVREAHERQRAAAARHPEKGINRQAEVEAVKRWPESDHPPGACLTPGGRIRLPSHTPSRLKKTESNWTSRSPSSVLTTIRRLNPSQCYFNDWLSRNGQKKSESVGESAGA